jgi:flagella basal body P-ring formation protein FlgA
MTRTECDKPNHRRIVPETDVRGRAGRRRPALGRIPTVVAALAWTTPSWGGTVRMLSTAVVTEDPVRVGDLCELRGFDAESERRLALQPVCEAPPPGGSRIVHVQGVRSAAAASGLHPGGVTLHGAAECVVTRPAAAREEKRAAAPSNREASVPSAAAPTTLRQTVTDFFNAELVRYRGQADVLFDRGAEQALNLSGPTYEFRVRRQGGEPLDLVPLEIDLIHQGQVERTIPLVARVSMIRPVVVARRPINPGSTIRAADVELTSLTFHRLEQIGLDDLALCLGQRSKRLIPPGTMIDSSMLEPVPVVLRGQIVTLVSEAGNVRVVTSAKAEEDGLPGAVITVRAVEDRTITYEAVVVGPGKTRIGPAGHEESGERLAGGTPW